MNEREGFIWVDGEICPWREARLHVLTHGLHYASSVFEGERSYGGSVFELTRHTQRLIQSAALLDMKLPFSEQELNEATLAVLSANELKDAYIRPVVWRGSETISAAAPNNRIHMAIAAWDWPSYFNEQDRLNGIKIQTASWRRPPPECSPPQAKAASNYPITTLAKHAALKNGFQDALLLDWRGNVAEASAANIFFVAGEEIHTPTPDCFLNGITRQTVIALAQNMGFKVIEREISHAETLAFTECFLTGTASEITPVGAIDAVTYKPGSVTGWLTGAYADLVRSKNVSAIDMQFQAQLG
ncbi:branched-chain amino acid aminotransferase [Mesorhizobium sp. CO1-1-11]|uniref:branched-chain amino acid aminotransferase n=1 Tax=Mesorhizobium sp. CO1-1-11 TaxID=2876636 RepID=UPI001CCC3949|nr:branched-chain amino acid aminotransferase [Mesorhizobium sp. CO1-1-11]MBZ9726304.1 branched-chain amino acid aminotransferase [Mesorhizobium sp. CO1-1-11]